MSAFLKHGISYVVSTLWRVRDSASVLLLIKFYYLRHQGEAEPAALALAKQWLREVTWGEIREFYQELLTEFSREPAEPYLLRRDVEDAMAIALKKPESDRFFEDPYYWAAFTITGCM